MSNKITILRVVKNGWQNFWRNIWLSAAATSVMTITLSIISILLVLTFLTSLSLDSIKEKVDIAVYFEPGTEDQIITETENKIKNIEGVTATTYISADEAYADFQKRHANDPLILEALKELAENPLYPTLVVKSNNIDRYPQIASDIEEVQVAEIARVNFEDNRRAIETLGRLTTGIQNGGLVLAIIFALVSILVTYNTIRLTIYNRREEVEIMRLVGATNSYIRWPFIIEGLLYGMTAAILSMAILLPMLSSFIPKVNNFLGVTLDLSYLSSNIFWQIVILELVLGAVLGVLSSVIAIRKYLNV